MGKDSFYVFLPSNASKNPNDTNTRFTIENSNTNIELTDKWKVGISEVFLPSTLYNITKEMVKNTFYLTRRYKETNEETGEREQKIERYDIELLEGIYSANQFEKEVNNIIKKYDKSGKKKFETHFYYKSTLRKFYISIGYKEELHIENERLKFILGLPYAEEDCLPYLRYSTIIYYLPYTVDFFAYLRHIYIYCNIVSYSQVGNIHAPIIRVISLQNFKTDNYKTQYYNFDNIQYFDLITPRISSINIGITDSLGSYLNFPKGEVLIVLHFLKEK